MQPTDRPARPLRLAVVGDLLTVASDERRTPRSEELLSAELRATLTSCDHVLGNLECALACGAQRVPTRPRVVSDEPTVRAIRRAGITTVTLANNHMFDALPAGCTRLRALLDELGMAHFGAGDTAAEAEAAHIIEAKGYRLAFLGAADERCGASHFAHDGCCGVARFDVDRLSQAIGQMRSEVDHVFVCVHWGEERFAIPAPAQIDAARRLVDAGASAVLGHHPHVLQGIEHHRGRPIVYSLGNFLADDVPYADGDYIQWNPQERCSCVLILEVARHDVRISQQIATHDDGWQVAVDASDRGTKRIRRLSRAIRGGVSQARFRREHLWVRTVLPALRHLHWSQWRKWNWRHVSKVVRSLRQSLEAK